MNIFANFDLAAALPLRLPVSTLRQPDGEPLIDRDGFPELLAVGPWLVDLKRRPELSNIWQASGRWRNWGYTLRTEAELHELRFHLRKFNLIRIAGVASPVFFRNFDALVLRRFLLEVATDSQIDAFFGPIERISIEDPANSRVIDIVNPRLVSG